jgi:hypothetical protein
MAVSQVLFCLTASLSPALFTYQSEGKKSQEKTGQAVSGCRLKFQVSGFELLLEN